MNILVKYLPFILQAILAVQAAAPTLKGQTKKQIATTLVTLGAGIAGAAPESHVAAIGNAIDQIVPVLQASGLMSKDAAPAVNQ